MEVVDDADEAIEPPSGPLGKAREFFRSRAPRGWEICVGAPLLVFVGHAMVGANSAALAGMFSAFWFVLAAFAMLRIGSDALMVGPRLVAAGACVMGVVVIGLLQLTPMWFGGAHPLWDLTEATGAVTLDKDATQRELIKILALFAIFMVGVAIGRSDRRVKLFYISFIILGGLYAVWGFVDYFTFPGTLYGATRPYHGDRLAATFMSANTAATCFAVVAIFAGARLAQAIKQTAIDGVTLFMRFERLAREGGVAASVFLFAASCVLLTASRAGAAVFLAALLLLIAWEVRAALGRRATARGLSVLAVLAAMALAALALMSGDFTAERAARTLSDAPMRLTLFGAHWNAFLEAPLGGYGLGTFNAVNALMMTAQNRLILEDVNAAHNVVLQWLEEGGVFAAALMFTAVALVIDQVRVGLTQRKRLKSWLRATLIVSAIMIVHGLVDYAIQVPSMSAQWTLLLGVAAGLALRAPGRRARN